LAGNGLGCDIEFFNRILLNRTFASSSNGIFFETSGATNKT